MSKRKIKKALWGLQLSSSPLTSLNPSYSANQGPNYNLALNFNLGLLSNPLQLSPEILQQWNKLESDWRSLKFGLDLKLSTSKDPLAAQLGLAGVLQEMDRLSLLLFSGQGPASSLSPNDLYADQVARLNGSNFSMSSALGATGQILGAQLGGKGGEVTSNVLGAARSVWNSASNLKEIGALQKAGVEGLGKAKAGNIAAIGGAVADLASSFLPEKTEYAGDKGGITQTMDSVYDGISDAAMSFGPIGMMVGGIMKGGKLLGGVMNSVGGGTDGMTTTDAILGSSFLNLTPIGLINGFGGQKAETITKNELAFEEVGASYTGTGRSVDDALKKSGKKYGLFSSGARKEANEEILEARRLQAIMEDIAAEASDRRAIRNSMAAINENRRRLALLGGYSQSAIRAGRHGMIIQDLLRAKRIVSTIKYQAGGKTQDPFEAYLQTLPEYQRSSTDFRVKDYWEFNGRPKNFDEAVFKGMFTKYEDGWHANSVAENPKTGEIEFMKSSTHPSILKELDWYESDEASEFRNEYELQKTEPYYKYVKKKGTDTPQSFKEGGVFSQWLVEVNIDDISPEFREVGLQEISIDDVLPEFKEGGKFNLIPEGALHARKHNMDVEGITPKGIPVVSQDDDGEIEQQAEIEREEIIFRLEVTRKLEELAKDGSDEAAIEAGKLLTLEILYNTIDNTNNLI